MRLGPNGEAIGPYLPHAEGDYWEPSPQHLAVGAPMSDTLLETREQFELAHRARMQGYMRAFDDDCASSASAVHGEGGGGGEGGARGSVEQDCADGLRGGGEGWEEVSRGVCGLGGGWDSDTKRQLKIEVGVVKRLMKDLEQNGLETSQQRIRVGTLKKSAPADCHDLKQQEVVLAEAEASICDTRQRLK